MRSGLMSRKNTLHRVCRGLVVPNIWEALKQGRAPFHSTGRLLHGIFNIMEESY